MANKIFYKVNESDYRIETENLIFFFSSQLYKDKFLLKYLANREDLKYKISSRFNIEFSANDYFDIILYSTIEKRGFFIKSLTNGGEYKCLKEVKLSGMIMT